MARSHFSATSETSPATEFGPLRTYAAELAQHEPVRRPPWWRNPTFRMVFWALDVPFTLWLTWGWFARGDVAFAVVIGIPATFACALWAVQNWRLHQAARTRSQ